MWAFSLNAQYSPQEQKAIDSLEAVIDSDIHDTVRVKSIMTLDYIVYLADPEWDLELNKEIARICELHLSTTTISEEEKDFYLRYISSAYNNLGLIFSHQNEYATSLSYYFKGLRVAEETNEQRRIGDLSNNVGLIYRELDEPEKALEFYEKAINSYQIINDEMGLMNANSNVAVLHDEQGNYKEALKRYYTIAYMHEEVDLRMTGSINNIGELFMDIALQIDSGTVDTSQIYPWMLDRDLLMDSSLFYINRALDARIEFGDVYRLTTSYLNLGNYYFLEGDYLKAITNFESAMKCASEAEAIEEVSMSHEMLAKAQFQLGQRSGSVQDKAKYFKSSAENFHKYVELYKEFLETQNQKEIGKMEASYEYNLEQQAADAKHKNELAISEEKQARQKIVITAIVIGFILVALFAFWIYRRFKVSRRQNQIIVQQKRIVDEKNQEILDSISYAKRIQSAILPPSKLVKESLPDSFILYKPKDIVAGDFYWLEEKGDEVLFAAADCTGHGVPGAMVSVICNNGLNRSVREHDLTDPGKILEKTREIVIKEFEKSEEEVKDGMDIALCSLKTSSSSSSVLHYAGAHNPLWIVRNGASEIEEIKADKQPIGKFREASEFNTHKVELNKGDTIYVFSDGYADQFGGEKGKKFKAANFKKLLLSIQNEGMMQQKQRLDEAFENWKGSLEQLDDVCVIGVRI